MAATEVEIEIPSGVTRVSISVGLYNPQDGDSKRGVRVTDVDWETLPAPEFFEEETGHIGRAEEEELVEQLIAALKEQGFRPKGDRYPCDLSEGYGISFESDVAV